MTGNKLHRSATLILSLVMAVIGVALIVEAVGEGGGFALRLVIGLLFLAAGLGRVYVETRKGRRRAP